VLFGFLRRRLIPTCRDSPLSYFGTCLAAEESTERGE